MIDIKLGSSIDLLPECKDVDLVFADIPYPGMTIHDGSRGVLTAKGWHERFGSLASLVHRSLSNDGVFVVLLNTKQEYDFVFDFVPYVKSAGFNLIDHAVWYKPSLSYSPTSKNTRRLKQMYDHIFVFAKSLNYKFNAWKISKDRLKELNRVYGMAVNVYSGASNVQDEAYWAAVSEVERKHVGRCPRRLVEYFIELYTDLGDLVLDPFLGSGTTAAACVNTERSCIGIDINPENVKLAHAYVRHQESQKKKGLL